MEMNYYSGDNSGKIQLSQFIKKIVYKLFIEFLPQQFQIE